jgi:agmatine deiminase
MKQSSPKSRGYRMPAEWELQEAIWLAWPHNELTWPGAMLAGVERSYIEIVQALHTGQKVKLLVQDSASEARIRGLLDRHGVDLNQVVFLQIATEDAWIRDYGPTFVVNKESQELAMVEWIFNAWGNKYDDLLADNSIPYKINETLRMAMFEPGIVLEGGSIEVNGTGAVLTTEQCLLNKNRNPHLGRAEIEKYLMEYLNVQEVLWLKEGIVGDDTDGHIDDIARFVDEKTVICAVEEDRSDENYKILKENYERLQGVIANVIRLPMPGYVGDRGARLPASYANFYIGNQAVVVPIFGHSNDNRAVDIIQECFPKRKVVGVHATAMVHGLGTIHCCSQQEPRIERI